MPASRLYLSVCLALVAIPVLGAPPPAPEAGLLFYLSGTRRFTAEVARPGTAEPVFVNDVETIPDGAKGEALRCAGTQLLSYRAPGNVYAQRGTLSLFWRARDPLGSTAFPIFRIGYADHSSWDMVFLRVDWNGHGFDAFVTDVSLARTRVSHRVARTPRADQWVHLAVAWDETIGVRLYVDGALAGSQDGQAVLDAGLDQLGPHSRIISPYQVQSAYNFVRGGDVDEVRIYDRMLDATQVARLARKQQAAAAPLVRSLAEPRWRDEWGLRFGWAARDAPPPVLPGNATSVRKVEVHDVYDLKQWMWKATDGIRETTWPGVYNRSRLPGRTDYFILPDWNCYSLSGKSVRFALPQERWNHLEVEGAAFGRFSYSAAGRPESGILSRAPGRQRSAHRLESPLQGGQLRFENEVQETPIGELGVYDVATGHEPEGTLVLRYTLAPGEPPTNASLAPLVEHIQGRFPADERAIIVARPEATRGSGFRMRRAESVAPGPAVVRGGPEPLPIVHLLVPFDLRLPEASRPRVFTTQTWENVDGGLDGIAIDLPALTVPPTHGELVPMNVQIKDPLWPARNLLDFTFSVRPGEPHTLWLDTRDRLLPNGHSLYLTLASASPEFGVGSLRDTRLRLVFRSREEARKEHEIDRFTQVRDNWGFLVEEFPQDKRLLLYERFSRDMGDLLRVNPDHVLGRSYWVNNNPIQGRPPFEQPQPPKGVPAWAFRQGRALALLRHFVEWWIDERQIANGEFGGGLSDDGDLTNQWPGAALMGLVPEKVTRSLTRLMDAFYEQGMFTNGLATIQTDELHSYEEGISVIPQTMLLEYGSPTAVERLMETARAVEGLTEVNAAGHRHITSSYFSGSRIAREGVWEWTKPHSYLILHPGMALVEWNGHPRAKKLLLELADGYLAHRKQSPDGSFALPEQIHFTSDAERGVGPQNALYLFWAAWRWTADPRYLAPILDETARFPALFESLNANTVDLLGQREGWGARQAKEARGDFGRHLAWQLRGDKAPLEAYYGDLVRALSQDMYMLTEGHLWSDRVVAPSAELQRSRLGGVALLRNRTYPGHVVSWDFDAPGSAERVAILLQRAVPDSIKVIAFNMHSEPVRATMTGWDVSPGDWALTVGVDQNGDDETDAISLTRLVPFERTRTVPVTFVPMQTTIVELTRKTPGQPYWERPDIGIDARDVRVDGRKMTVRLHSLGAVDAPESKVTLRDVSGRIVATAEAPAIPAPHDLRPKTTEVELTLPEGLRLSGVRVRVEALEGLGEITDRNNAVQLP